MPQLYRESGLVKLTMENRYFTSARMFCNNPAHSIKINVKTKTALRGPIPPLKYADPVLKGQYHEIDQAFISMGLLLYYRL